MTGESWHTSSYSGNAGGECVEVWEGPKTRVRDTKNRDDGEIKVPATEWVALVKATAKA